MKKVQVELVLYRIDELNIESRDRAIEEHTDFLLTMFNEDDYDCDYSYSEYYNDMNDSYVIESIEVNGYLYFEDGGMANVTRYCGQHGRSGETVLTFNNIEYVL